ncbi:MAG: hypothetical protein JOY96_02890 [Verrucomicrobia bacterium]|nr:hypothetical protein [Verrucomicrobiota bacterium]
MRSTFCSSLPSSPLDIGLASVKTRVSGAPSSVDTGAIIVDEPNYQNFVRK